MIDIIHMTTHDNNQAALMCTVIHMTTQSPTGTASLLELHNISVIYEPRG